MYTYIKKWIDAVLTLRWKKGSKKKRDTPRPAILSEINNETLLQVAIQYQGKLLLRDEIYLDETTFQSLLHLQYFTAIPSIQSKHFTTTCMRCNNQNQSQFASIDCARCKKTHPYCRKCLTMGRVLFCEPLYAWTKNVYSYPRLSDACTWKGTLTSAQQRAADEIHRTVTVTGELLVWAVTGAGKTEMLFPGITTALEQGKRVCLATPRADVVRELLPRIQSAFSNVSIQALYGGSKDKHGTAPFIIATTHQLLRYIDTFDVLIIDEIDAFPYHLDESLQFAAKRAVKQTASLIYLTATPRKKLRQQVQLKKINYVFVPARFHGHPLPIPTNVYCARLKRYLDQTIIPQRFIEWLHKRNNKTRQLLIFIPTIELASTLLEPLTNELLEQKVLNHRGEMVYVHAEDKEREQKIERFRKRELYALLTTTILERGVTFPSIDVAVLHAGHDVFDEPALVQIAGRAGRSATDPTGEVVFFHDGITDAIKSAQHSIMEMNQRAKKMLLRGD